MPLAEIVAGSVVALREPPDDEGAVSFRFTGSVALDPKVEFERYLCAAVFYAGEAVLQVADAWLDADNRVGDTANFTLDERLRAPLAQRLTHVELRAAGRGRLVLGEHTAPTSIHSPTDGDGRFNPPTVVAFDAATVALSAHTQYGRDVDVQAIARFRELDPRWTTFHLVATVLDASGAAIQQEDTRRDLEWRNPAGGIEVAQCDVRFPAGRWALASHVRIRVGVELRETGATVRIGRDEIPEAPR